MGVGDHDGMGIYLPRFSGPVPAAVNHDPPPMVFDEEGRMPAVSSCPGLDLSTGAEEYDLHSQAASIFPMRISYYGLLLLRQAILSGIIEISH